MKSADWLTRLEPRLARQMRFLVEADRLKGVERRSRINGGARRENVAEHSWHVSLFAMVLAEWAVAPVDIGMVVEMLLLHDLVEIEAGDTPLYDKGSAASQAEREAAAAELIFGLLPADQAGRFRALWSEFEAAQSPEAKFAKALDRLQPILLNHLVGGGTWTEYDVDETRVRALTGRIAEGSQTLWSLAETVFADAVAKGWLRPPPDAAQT